MVFCDISRLNIAIQRGSSKENICNFWLIADSFLPVRTLTMQNTSFRDCSSVVWMLLRMKTFGLLQLINLPRSFYLLLVRVVKQGGTRSFQTSLPSRRSRQKKTQQWCRWYMCSLHFWFTQNSGECWPQGLASDTSPQSIQNFCWRISRRG